MRRNQPDTFKPIAPPGGRDWLTRGFGLHPCRCKKCNPPEEREQRRAAPAEPEQKHELEIAGTPA